jgi:hypothetical protein
MVLDANQPGAAQPSELAPPSHHSLRVAKWTSASTVATVSESSLPHRTRSEEASRSYADADKASYGVEESRVTQNLYVRFRKLPFISSPDGLKALLVLPGATPRTGGHPVRCAAMGLSAGGRGCAGAGLGRCERRRRGGQCVWWRAVRRGVSAAAAYLRRGIRGRLHHLVGYAHAGANLPGGGTNHPGASGIDFQRSQ